VLAGGIFIFAVIAFVIGFGALQQFVLKPRAAVARVNGETIQRQWYDKNVEYSRVVLQRETQDIQTQYQALTANQRANAAATATANPQPSTAASAPATPAPSTSSSAETPSPSGSATPTFSPAPTFNPQESATVSALTNQFSADQRQLSAVEQETVDDLIDADLMRQNAAKLAISVSQDDVAAEGRKVSDRLGDAGRKQLFEMAHLSQSDFDQIQYNAVLKVRFQQYFADHPEAAPSPSPTPVLTPTLEATTTGPRAPTPTATPTPVPTPGADSLDRWLQQQRAAASITRSSFLLPT
jgi:single-stranded DNA-binding protein